MMVQSPFEDHDAPSSRHRPLVGALGTNEVPTAKGVLETTPLPHVLVYMLDHFLNGTVVLYPLGQAESVIYFQQGTPSKARLGMAGFFLGEYLVEVGALRPERVAEAIRNAKQAGLLMGEYLVRTSVVSRPVLEAALQRQLVQRVAYLANLPPATEYAFFGERDFLADGASGDAVHVGALNPILAAVRIWKDRARVRATLARIGHHPLILADDVDVAALTLTPAEEAVLDAIVTRRPTVTDLLQLNVTDAETVSSVVYALAVTRQFAFPGQQKAPMAPRKQSVLPPSMESASSSGAASQAPRSMAPKGSLQVRPALVPRRATSAGMPAASVAGSQLQGPTSSATSSSKFAAVSTRVPNAPSSGAIPSARGSSSSSPASARSGAFSPQPPSVSTSRNVQGPSSPRVPAAPIAPAPASQAQTRTSQTSIPPALGGFLPPVRGDRPAPPSASGAQMTAPPPSMTTAGAYAGDVDPEQALAAMTHFRTAETQLQRGDLPGALIAAEKAAAADPTQTEYLALRAWVAALAKGNPQVNASIADLDELIARDPSSERALLYRGKLYKRANRSEEALRDLEQLLVLNPKHREATGEVRLLKMHVKKA